MEACDNTQYFLPSEVPDGYDNVVNEKSRRRSKWLRNTFLALLTFFSIVGFTLSIYMFTHRFLTEKNKSPNKDLISLEKEIKYEASSSRWGNYSAEVANYESEVKRLRLAIHATVESMNRHKKTSMSAQVTLDRKITEVKSSLSKHLSQVSRNNASIERLSAQVFGLMKAFDDHQMQDDRDSKDLRSKLYHLKTQLSEKYGQYEKKLKNFGTRLEEQKWAYDDLKDELSKLRTKMDDMHAPVAACGHLTMSALVIFCASVVASIMHASIPAELTK